MTWAIISLICGVLSCVAAVLTVMVLRRMDKDIDQAIREIEEEDDTFCIIDDPIRDTPTTPQAQKANAEWYEKHYGTKEDQC